MLKKFLLLVVIAFSIGIIDCHPASGAWSYDPRTDALSRFAFAGDLEAIQSLVATGINIKSHREVFREAIQSNNIDLVSYLLDQGCNVNTVSRYQGTPLVMAASSGSVTMVQFLLDHHADTNVKGEFEPALIAAVTKGHTEIVQLLLAHGAKVNITGERIGSPLHAASQNRDSSLVRLLLEHGALPNLRGRSRQTPLMVAAHFGRIEAIKLLLAHGADASLKDKDGNTCVDIANDLIHPTTLKYLKSATRLKARYSPRMTRTLQLYGGSTMMQTQVDLLTQVALNDDLEAVKSLIERGVNVNGVAGLDIVPLAAAAQSGDIDIMRQLLDHGANMYQQYGEGMFPIDDALSSGRWDVYQLFVQHGAHLQDTIDPLVMREAIKTKNHDIIAAAMTSGKLQDHDDKPGDDLIIDAAWKQDPALIAFLLAIGADVNKQDGDHGRTPLMLAASYGRIETIKLLLDHGADFSLSDHDGKTALDYANDGYHPKTLAFLKEAIDKSSK